MVKKQTFYLLILVFLLLPASHELVLAHGTGGTYEESIDGYYIDNGFTPEEPTVGSLARFDFSVTNESDPEEDSYTDVWVRITKQGELVFSGDIHNPNIGPTGFTQVFSEPGEYEIFSRFQNDSDTVVEATYTITVLPSNSKAEGATEGADVSAFIWLCLAAAFGLLVGFVIGRKLTTSGSASTTNNSA